MACTSCENDNCSCSEQVTIPNGSDGTNGVDGLFGGFSHKFVFNTSTSATPASTTIRLNNAVMASVTSIYISDNNSDAVSVDAFLDEFSNSGNYGYIRLFKEYDSSKFWMGEITGVVDNGSDHSLTVTHINSNSTFSASDKIVVSFVANGAPGPAGSTPLYYFIKTYAQLTTLVSASGLIPGALYELSDYETKHKVTGSGTLNTGTVGYVSRVESLLLTAKSTTSFYHEVKSLTNPEDSILYDFTSSTVPVLGTARNGIIYWRKDNTNNIEAWFDVRNQTVARYSMDPTTVTYVSGTIGRGVVKYITGTSSYVVSMQAGTTNLDNYRMLQEIDAADQQLYSNNAPTFMLTSIPILTSGVTFHQSIPSTLISNVKLGKGCDDILLDISSTVVMGDNCVGVSITNSQIIKIGASSTNIILQTCTNVELDESCSHIYQFSTLTSKISGVKHLGIASVGNTIKTGSDKSLLHSCNENILELGTVSVMMNRGSNSNTIGVNTSGITLGNSQSNSFEQSCSDIQIFSGGWNRFAQGCSTINLLGELDASFIGGTTTNGIELGLNYYSPYSQMKNNTFGTSCSNITFNVLGGRGNQFGDECKNLTFTQNAQTWRLVGCYFSRGIKNKTFQHVMHGCSFLVPNQVVATITSTNYYSPMLHFYDARTSVGYQVPNSGALQGDFHSRAPESSHKIGSERLQTITTNGLHIGYKTAYLPYYNPPTTPSDQVAQYGTSGTAITDADTRIAADNPNSHAFMWTPEGYPLSMTMLQMTSMYTDPTAGLNYP